VGLISYLRGDDISLGIDAENRVLTRETIPVDTWEAWAPRWPALAARAFELVSEERR
jgi:hypothetical protein